MANDKLSWFKDKKNLAISVLGTISLMAFLNIVNLNKDINRLKYENYSLEQELRTTKEELSTLKESGSAYKQDIEQLESEAAELVSALDSMETSLKNFDYEDWRIVVPEVVRNFYDLAPKARDISSTSDRLSEKLKKDSENSTSNYPSY